MSSLELRGLRKQLGDHLAVDDVDLTVAEGEFMVLLGASGSGKTTTLRLVCGLERPDAGEIILDGRDIAGLKPRERNLGMVFQEYGLYPALNVAENIAYGLRARGEVPKVEIDRRVADAAQRLGLADRLHNSTQDLSGGEQQRVALARALVKDASAYLFDEPLSNLDAKMRHSARRDIVAVHKAKRQPSLYVTHDQNEAFAMGDRIAVMAQGRIRQVGTPHELLDAPADTWVARFIGSPPMNVLAARRSADDRASTDFGEIALPQPCVDQLRGQDHGPVLVGFRPTAVVGCHRNGDASRSALTATVETATVGFTELLVTIRAEGGEVATLEITDDIEFEPGDRIGFDLDPDAIRLFDADSERALG